MLFEFSLPHLLVPAVQQDDSVKVSFFSEGVILPLSSSGSFGDKSPLCLFVF